jgi:hypothetical protein
MGLAVFRRVGVVTTLVRRFSGQLMHSIDLQKIGRFFFQAMLSSTAVEPIISSINIAIDMLNLFMLSACGVLMIH